MEYDLPLVSVYGPYKNVRAIHQRAWLSLHILTEVKNVTILKGMFLCKIVSSEELVIVVALHIFESDCYNFSQWESRKYGGPEVVKFMFKNCNLHFSSVGYSYSMIQPYMSIMCTKLTMCARDANRRHFRGCCIAMRG